MVKIDNASVSYLLGILSIVFAFFTPLAGLVLGIIGLRQAKKGKSEKGKKLSTIGIIISAILLVLSIVLFFYSVSSGLNTGFPAI